VETVLRHHIQLQGVEESDEIFRRCQDQATSSPSSGAIGSLLLGRLLDGCRQTNTEALRGSRAFNLSQHVSNIHGLFSRLHTSHSRLNVSRSTNALETDSSLRLDLYCLRRRLHVSVYSDSVIESLMYAFSKPSSVTMML